MSSQIKYLLIPALPLPWFGLALPAVQAPSDILYFYGGVFAVAYTFLFKQEPILLYLALATLPLLFVPCIYRCVFNKVPFWIILLISAFAIGNGCLGLLVMYGRWC